ncbi:hypothetical protein ACFQ0D_37565, partial [Micromonospora zhanjiangensis]
MTTSPTPGESAGTSPTTSPGNPGDIPPLPSGRSAAPTPAGSPAAPVTLTGTVTAGVGPNCLLLDNYLLVNGPRDVVKPGARVTVTEIVRHGARPRSIGGGRRRVPAQPDRPARQ